MNEFMQRVGARKRPVSDDEVPPELARALDKSVEDLRHDRTEDVSEFLKKMQAKIEAAMARDTETNGPKR